MKTLALYLDAAAVSVTAARAAHLDLIEARSLIEQAMTALDLAQRTCEELLVEHVPPVHTWELGE